MPGCVYVSGPSSPLLIQFNDFMCFASGAHLSPGTLHVAVGWEVEGSSALYRVFQRSPLFATNTCQRPESGFL